MSKRGRKISKKGLSTIIVTLILILISLVAIGVFWVVIQNLIDGNTENIGLDKLTLSAEIKGVNIDNSSNNVTLAIKRNVGEGDLVGMKFVFYNDSSTEIIAQDFELEQLVERKFVLHLAMNVSTLTKISIVPLFRSSQGEENVGNIADSYDVRTGKRIETPTTEPPAGCTPTANPCGSAVCGTAQNGTCGNVSCGTCGSGYDCIGGTCVLQTGILCELNTYYVDFENGNDNNNGLCSDSAWKHAPGDNNAVGVAASTNLVAGNIVRFRGGIEYAGMVTINWGGSSNSYITYLGNADGIWGIGSAKINLNNSYYHAFSSSLKNYIKIIGFDIYNVKNTKNDQNVLVWRNGSSQLVNYAGSGITGDLGVILNSRGSNWIIQNCIFHDVENYADTCLENAEQDGDASTLSSVPSDQAQIRMRGPGIENITIEGNELYAFGLTGINIYGTKNVTIKNNNFGGINRGQKTGWFSVAIRIESSAGTIGSENVNIYVGNNTFHDGWQYEGDDPLQRCHAGDWIHMYGAPNVMPDNITYDGNFWYNDKSFVTTHGSAMSQIDSARNIYVRNNVFVNPHAGNGAINFHSDINNSYFENNLVIVYPHGTGVSNGISVNGKGNGYIRNNIFVHFDGGICIYDSTATSLPADSNNNIFYLPNGGTIYRYSTTYYNLDTWRTFSGLDGLSSSQNPNLVSIPINAALSSQGNYHLTSSSANAIDSAKIINSFSLDKEKISRPQGSAWDIGPYEYH